MNFSRNDTVAIIDSGIGGVSVLNKLVKKYKAGNYIYFADNEFMPYGNKTKQQIASRVNKIINYLKENYSVSKFIIACNTASSCINSTESIFCMNFNKKQCYLATSLTKNNLNKTNIIADKTLAAEIEKYITNKSKLNEIVLKHIHKHKLYKYKSIILGCTHYELVADIFKKNLPKTTITCNSKTLLNKIHIETNNHLNIVLIMSKYSKHYYDKFYKVLVK